MAISIRHPPPAMTRTNAISPSGALEAVGAMQLHGLALA